MGPASLDRQAVYPWVICAAGTLLIFCSIGLCGNIMPVYYPFLAAEKGFNNAELSAITTFRCAGAFVSMGLLPRLIRRIRLRPLPLLTCLIVGASLLLMSAAQSLFTLYVAATGTGLAYGLGSMVLVSPLVRNWFSRREGLVLSICACGSGLANLVASPLITWAVEQFGLKTAFRLEAAVAVLLGLIMFAIVRDEPAALGLLPYGGERRQSAEPQASPASTVRLSRRHQGLMLVAVLATGPANIGAFSFFTMQCAGAGYSPMTIAAALSVFGLELTAAKLLYGWCNDRFGVYRCNFVFFGLIISGNLLLALLPQFRPGFLIFLALGLTALGYPPLMIGLSLWARDLSPAAGYTKKVALYQQLSMAGGMAGTMAGGFSADRFGNYTPAYICCVLLLLLALVSIQYLYRRYGRDRRA